MLMSNTSTFIIIHLISSLLKSRTVMYFLRLRHVNVEKGAGAAVHLFDITVHDLSSSISLSLQRCIVKTQDTNSDHRPLEKCC